nr:MAG TPA: hypothetical protein [Bacteriophage sp.]
MIYLKLVLVILMLVIVDFMWEILVILLYLWLITLLEEFSIKVSYN